MGKRSYKLLIAFLIGFNLIPLFSCVSVQNPHSFGLRAEDGCKLQVFIVEEVMFQSREQELIIRFPQDTKLLEYNYFYLYLSIPDTEYHYVNVSYYELNNKTGAIIGLIDREFVPLRSGVNEWGESGFGMVKMDSSFMPEFTDTAVKRKFIIQYLDISFEFIHKTNPSLVEITVAQGILNMQMITIVFVAFFFFCGTAYLSSRLRNDLGTWMEFNTETVLLVFTWLISGFVITNLLQGSSESEIFRDLIQVPVILLTFIFAVLSGVWVPSFFLDEPTELHIIKYNPLVPLEKVVSAFMQGLKSKNPLNEITIGHEVLHVVKTSKGRRYYKDSRDPFEIIGNWIHGSTAIKGIEQCYVVEVTEDSYTRLLEMSIKQRIKRKIRSLIKERFVKQDLGFHLQNAEDKVELVFVKDYEWQKMEFDNSNFIDRILNDTKIMLLAFLAVTIGVTVLLSMFHADSQIIGIIIFILIMFFLGFFIYDYTKQYKYLKIEPISRGVIELIVDSHRVEHIETATKVRIAELIEQRDSLKKELVLQEVAYKSMRLIEMELLEKGEEAPSELKAVAEALKLRFTNRKQLADIEGDESEQESQKND